ncbi:hypothetical protein WJX81_002152 [Elliptochloris bilobata]|uniref:SBP-type domain-containing protein n=1 Tax=Elliptochloris bilobata TaxID=381761 RepID=A0AAW1RXZ2_9CHLO
MARCSQAGHKRPGNVNVLQACGHQGCSKTASYGHWGGNPRVFCFEHRERDMVSAAVQAKAKREQGHGGAPRAAAGAKGAPAKPGQKRGRSKGDCGGMPAKRPRLRGPRLRLPRVLTGPQAVTGHPVVTGAAEPPPFLKVKAEAAQAACLGAVHLHACAAPAYPAEEVNAARATGAGHGAAGSAPAVTAGAGPFLAAMRAAWQPPVGAAVAASAGFSFAVQRSMSLADALGIVPDGAEPLTPLTPQPSFFAEALAALAGATSAEPNAAGGLPSLGLAGLGSLGGAGLPSAPSPFSEALAAMASSATPGADAPPTFPAQASAAFAEALAAIAAPAGPGAGLPSASSLSPAEALAAFTSSTGREPASAACLRITDALAARPRTPPAPGLSFMQVLAPLAPSTTLGTPPQRSPTAPARPPIVVPMDGPGSGLGPGSGSGKGMTPAPAPRPAGRLFSDALLENVVQRHLAQRGVPPLYLPGAAALPAHPGGLPGVALGGGFVPSHALSSKSRAGGLDASLATRSHSAPHWLDALANGAPLPAWQ